MFFALQAESFIFTLVACAAYLPSSESIRSHSIRRNLAGASQGLNATSTIFDYVIVGGGTAGLTLAARLSETPSTRVAVIEAGGFYEDSIGNGSQLSIPAEDILWAGKNVTDVNLNVDWGFDTVPQAGANNQIIHYARGKTLGGCTARNYMAYQRGTTEAYQRWADEVDDQSYTFNALLPFFEKSLNFTPPNNAKRGLNATPQYDTRTLGAGGQPLDITFPNYALSFSTWIQKGLEVIGIKPINGFTSGQLLGSSFNIATINQTTGLRESSETAFLQPALDRPNLVVYTHTLAKKILFENTTATGVLVDTGDQILTISAKKEVILSAGTLQSPQLLMVSGIGPKATLQQHNISIISERPGVGQNLWDHVLFGPTYNTSLITDSALGQPTYLNEAMQLFASEQSGLLSNPGSDFLAWEKLPLASRKSFSPRTIADLSTFPSDWPEIEYLSVGAYFGLQENYVTGAPHDTNQYGTLAVAIVAPLSRGNISISSPDTVDQPLINPNWLTHPTDQQVAVAAYRRAREVFSTPIMQKIIVGPEIYPGMQVQTDEEILNTIRLSFNTVYHAAATNKMGRKEDTMAVVDTRCRVYGLERLRVVDASSFPFLPPGHPMSTVYALAEKIADDIRSGGKENNGTSPVSYS